MVIATPALTSNIQRPIGEQRVLLSHVSWSAYLQILAALPEGRNSRLT
jgi:hypothetical protein